MRGFLRGAAVISLGTQTYTADSAVIAHDSNGIPLVNFTLQSVPPSKTQLIDAQHIQIAAVDRSLPTFDFTLPHAKMPALLTAVTECQQLACLIHRIAGIRRRVSRKVVIVTYELGA